VKEKLRQFPAAQVQGWPVLRQAGSVACNPLNTPLNIMTIPDKIKTFLSDITDLSIGYNEINFIQPENLDENQVGYSKDPDGNSLTTGNDGDWQVEWLVIATDQVGDPIIIDVSSPTLSVLSASNGEGSWEPFVIANGLDNFKNIISILKILSINREYPVDLDKHPISEYERQNALAQIEEQNPETEIWFWESFLEND
jgi:hypothetical protein